MVIFESQNVYHVSQMTSSGIQLLKIFVSAIESWTITAEKKKEDNILLILLVGQYGAFSLTANNSAPSCTEDLFTYKYKLRHVRPDRLVNWCVPFHGLTKLKKRF